MISSFLFSEDSIIEIRDESSVLDLENILISFRKYEENLSGKSKESFDYALLYVLDHYVYLNTELKNLIIFADPVDNLHESIEDYSSTLV